MDAETLERWYGFTPIFNGDQLEVEMVGTESVQGAFLDLRSIASLIEKEQKLNAEKGLCGDDSRTRGSRSGVARLWGAGLCTASLLMTGEHMVSAGHCGPLAEGDCVEFDPPDSSPLGVPQAAPPERQFPFIVGSMDRDSDFIVIDDRIQSYGDDGMIFRIGRNVLGQTAGMVHTGYIRITLNAGDRNFTKWGCGVMEPVTHPHNRTMKSTFGILGSDAVLDGGLFRTFNVDTTGGDSGGPIILNSFKASVGVVSFSGTTTCRGTGAYSFSDPDFRALIDNAVRARRNRFVEKPNGLISIAPAGSIWNPAPSFRTAYDTATADGQVFVAPGTYSTGDGVLDRVCTISAPFGGVTLMGLSEN